MTTKEIETKVENAIADVPASDVPTVEVPAKFFVKLSVLQASKKPLPYKLGYSLERFFSTASPLKAAIFSTGIVKEVPTLREAINKFLSAGAKSSGVAWDKKDLKVWGLKFNDEVPWDVLQDIVSCVEKLNNDVQSFADRFSTTVTTVVDEALDEDM